MEIYSYGKVKLSIDFSPFYVLFWSKGERIGLWPTSDYKNAINYVQYDSFEELMFP